MISDSSQLIFFAKCNRVDIPAHLFGKITISEYVLKEITQKEKAEEAEIIKAHIEAGDIIVKKLKKENLKKLMQIGIVFKGLGFGELEAIALAIQENEKYVLMDDIKAREAAELNGIQPIGALGVLLRAFEDEILTEKETERLFKQMISNKLWVSGRTVLTFYELLEKLKRKRK